MKPRKNPGKGIRAMWIAMALLAAALIAVLGYGVHRYNRNHPRTVVKATCTEPGYVMNSDLLTGTTSVEHLPVLGHDFSKWTADQAAATQSRTCSRCGFEETIRLSSVTDESIPTLRLKGSLDGIGKKVKVALEAEFSGMGQTFECYAIMTLQGHSTYGYEKRNYTVRFYDDDQSVVKHKVQFKDWNREHKYILKANYMDLSQCRNLIGARIFSLMAASREQLSPRLSALPTLGAVDGFPVSVYLNDEFFGLYTMNLHKDDDLYQMQEGERAALVICNQQTTEEALFRAPAAFLPDYSSDWEIEFCGTQDETWAKNSFNELIGFVMNSTDEEFREKLPSYLDREAAIDYLIFIYALGLQRSGAKDLVMLSYGDRWIPCAYDMDEAFGLDAERAAYLAPEAFVPVKTDGRWDSGTGSLLWDRMLNAFEDEIRARYAFLRGDVLSVENLNGMVGEFMGGIPEGLYDMDVNLYPGRPMKDPDMKTQITTYIEKRFEILDAILEVE